MFVYLTKSNAPKASLPLIEHSEKTYGFFPTLHALLANSPAAYKAYLKTFGWFENETSFSPLEQQVVFMTTNVYNRCHYCVPGHTYLMKMAKMPDDVIEALREDKVLGDKKLETLRAFTKALLQTHGHVDQAEKQAFFDAGYTPKHALDLLVGLAAKLISNYTNAITDNPPESASLAYAWSPETAASQTD